MDRDLLSIQEVRDLLRECKVAQSKYATFSQEEVDRIIYEMVEEIKLHNEKLAKMAAEETGFGNWEDKVLKNKFASEYLYEYIKDMKTIGKLKEENKVIEIGVPMGIIAALIPSTNPTSTAIYKVLISLKAGNGVVVSPHPNAKQSIIETVKILKEAAKKAGAPEGLIGVIQNTTMEATTELMKNRNTSLILATGGEAMVRAAYSSGTPAIGVGPGNGPAFIEKTANKALAVKRILDSKTFDNGVICASEQSIIVEEESKREVIEELKKQGAYFLDRDESKKLGEFILRSNGTMNPQIVGKTALKLAQLSGINVPCNTRVLVSEETEVSKNNPYSREKLAPILAFYTEENWEKACERSIEILNVEGKGHTMVIHSENKDVIMAFALKKPVSRLLVNTPGALGGVGGTTNLAPAMTLGCGAVGGSSTSDNITPLNLMNIRRVAWGVSELEDLKGVSNSQYTCEDGKLEELVKKVIADILNR
ncbi:acetaldehyde dehydrogenase (acetylating) [Cetobacterium sp. 8H]|uniref:acetaldehyde dehydrogenase (acetylating) n=1 Tax=Cetobacterium sp. 8H TaxID=2759681 RepID=UPI00163C59A3|nr:acetaldehyde dehydrogenase (acetylating) [Cetobacterium sp. 8H]MBC2851702.1 acetaldehyde dehydrogenase (acetylating) [Cetobacterium sp. 8H]